VAALVRVLVLVLVMTALERSLVLTPLQPLPLWLLSHPS
jgi:hypothetical protein